MACSCRSRRPAARTARLTCRVSSMAAVLPIVCNADDVAGAAAVPRGARRVRPLQVGSTSLTKVTTASSEAISEAPAAREVGPQCWDTIDNDGDDYVIDAADTGLSLRQRREQRGELQPQRQRRDKTADQTNDDRLRRRERRRVADNRDNDGDGLVDEKDGGCHTDGNPIQAHSYDPTDDSEAGGGGGDDKWCRQRADGRPVLRTTATSCRSPGAGRRRDHPGRLPDARGSLLLEAAGGHVASPVDA